MSLTHLDSITANVHAPANLFARQSNHRISVDTSTGDVTVDGKIWSLPTCLNDIGTRCEYSRRWVSECGDISNDCPAKCADIASGKFKTETEKCIKQFCAGDEQKKTIELFEAIQKASRAESDEVCKNEGLPRKDGLGSSAAGSVGVNLKTVLVTGLALAGVFLSL